MANIALYPGGYKPPHIGHYEAAKEALTQADKVIVFVGPKERDGITQDMSVALWKLYTEKDNIEIRPAGVSPVKDVYDFVELEAEDGDILSFIKGEKDSEDPRFARIPTYAEKFGKNITTKSINISDKTDRKGYPVSGTWMRGYIKKNNFQDFRTGLPKHLTAEQENEAWAIVIGYTDYSPPKGGTQSTYLGEDLNEGPQFGVLYHYTNYLIEILNDNQLGQTEGDPISLTRSRDSDLKDWAMDALGNKWAILVLDKDKLRQNYKITPYKDPEYDGYSGDEMEEQIQPPITNLNKYLVKVILREPREEWENYLKSKNIPYEVEDLNEGISDTINNLKEKLLDKIKNIKDATKEQIEELKRFLPVAKNVIVDKCGGSCSVEQKKELQLLFTDVIKSLGLAAFYIIPGGFTSNVIIGWFFKTITNDKFAGLLPSKIAAVLEELYNKPQSGEQPYGDTTRYKDHWKSNDPGSKKSVEPNYKYNRKNFPFRSMYESRGGESEMHIYDFDETIARVETPIPYTVKSPNGEIIEKGETTSIEFETKKDQLKDSYDEGITIDWDFKAFASMISNATLNNEVFQKLLNSIKNPNAKVTILTARAVGLPVTKFLKDQGIWAYVVPLGLNKEKGQSVTGEDKANWIENRLKNTTKKVIFIDDAPENRKAIYTLRDKYPDIEFSVETPPEISEMLGTMNNQEKAKHAKNLKRLNKDLRKQGDQYMEVPDYLKGTLTRKMYDENYPPYKVDQVQRTRYRASDVFTNSPKQAKKMGYLEIKNINESTAVINDKFIPLEIMETPDEQLTGMMGRNKLEGGMIFPYSDVSNRNFHMQGCKISLDIVFIIDNKIHKIHHNCPPCKEQKCPSYSGRADKVLELPGGYCKQHNINNNDHIGINLTPMPELINPEPLNEQEEEQGTRSKDELVNLVKDADLTISQIEKLHKIVSGYAYKDDILSIVHKKGFTADKFKTGNVAIETIFEKISESNIEEFMKYLENPKKFSDIKVGGNFATEIGISTQLANDLIQIEPGSDKSGSNVGKVEVFLGLMFSDVDNFVDKGDLNWGGKNLEIKGTGGRLGQQAGRGTDSKIRIENLAKEILSEDEYNQFLERLQTIKYSMVYSIKELFEKSTKGKDIIEKFQTAIDGTFWGYGVAKNYFKNTSDFEDEEQIKKNLIKVNSHAYALKTNVDVFLFANTSNGDYVIVNMEELDKAIDDVRFDTSVKGVTGYKWYDTNPNMVVREGNVQIGKQIEEEEPMARKESLFTKEWWKEIINEIIITEGGAAGHMAHPFDLPNVNDGRSLLNVFKEASDSLETNPGAVKIDGVNSSIRLIDLDGQKQFAMDRGSKKPLDIKGITKADLEDRFKPGHGLVKAGGEVLDMFNEALPSLQNDLKKLGAWDDPNILFNMEYVEGKTNVQKYDTNFIAIHVLNKIETKEVQGKRKMLTKRISSEISYDKSALQSLLDNLAPIAKKRGFEVYGSVPTEMIKKPNFAAALSVNYTIKSNEGNKTQSLEKWLNELNDIPKETFIFMDGIKRGAVSKLVYTTLLEGGNIDELFESEEDKQAAIEGWTTYLATEKLGDEVLKVLNSPMGSADNHEGVVIRDEKIASVPFKITGKFILGGMATGFR